MGYHSIDLYYTCGYFKHHNLRMILPSSLIFEKLFVRNVYLMYSYLLRPGKLVNANKNKNKIIYDLDLFFNLHMIDKRWLLYFRTLSNISSSVLFNIDFEEKKIRKNWPSKLGVYSWNTNAYANWCYELRETYKYTCLVRRLRKK